MAYHTIQRYLLEFQSFVKKRNTQIRFSRVFFFQVNRHFFFVVRHLSSGKHFSGLFEYTENYIMIMICVFFLYFLEKNVLRHPYGVAYLCSSVFPPLQYPALVSLCGRGSSRRIIIIIPNYTKSNNKVIFLLNYNSYTYNK